MVRRDRSHPSVTVWGLLNETPSTAPHDQACLAARDALPALRELDEAGIARVYARCPVGGGVAYAVQNRLKKAAAFHIVDAEEVL